MPIDPSIALGVRPMQFDDPVAKTLSLRSMIQQQQLHGEQLKSAQAANEKNTLAMKDQELARQAWKENPTDPDAMLKRAKELGVGPDYVTALEKHFTDVRKTNSEIADKDLVVKKYQNEQLAGLTSKALQMPDDQYAQAWPQLRQAAMQINPKLQLPEQPLSKDDLDHFRLVFTTDASLLAEDEGKRKQAGEVRAQAGETRAAAGETRAAALAPSQLATSQNTARKTGLEGDELQRKLDIIKNTTPADTIALVDQVVPPGVKENAALNARTKSIVLMKMQQGDIAGAQDAIKTAAAEMRQLEVATDPRVQQGKINVSVAGAVGRADAGGLTDDDYKRSGMQYGLTGVMPPMGRDSVTRGRIEHAKNEWARENGFTPQDLVQMQAAYAGDKESLKKFQGQRDQIVSFEQTAQKNLDLFLTAAQKIPDTGVPWLNVPIRNLDEKLVGSENMAAVNAARQVANNEIAKVTSGGGLGGVLSDSARHEVESYNSKNATFAQTLAVAKVLKQDMANRHGSMDAMLGEIRGRIGGGQQQPTSTPGTKKPLSEIFK